MVTMPAPGSGKVFPAANYYRTVHSTESEFFNGKYWKFKHSHNYIVVIFF